MKRCANCFREYREEFNICPYCGYEQGEEEDRLYYLPRGVMLMNRYQVGMVLGVGGFGITYRVWDTKYGLPKAVKEYYPAGLASRVAGSERVIHFGQKREAEYMYGLRRFLFEARNMAQFHSQNIREVYDFFEENDTAYIVMECLEGEPLSAYIKDRGGKFPWKEAAVYGTEVCNALTLIHEKHIIHRDISPDNIFRCEDGRIKLIDFGAAKFEKTEDYARAIVLKPGFAPPEQYEQITKQGPWTDLYGLGASLYYLMTGVKPDESVNRVIHDTVSYPKEIAEEIPETVSNAIMKAMALEPSMRFQSAREMKKALAQKKTVRRLNHERKRKAYKRLCGIFCMFTALLTAGGICLYCWQEKKQSEVLEETELIVWYMQPEGEEGKQARENAMQIVADEFEKSYPAVKIKMQSFVSESYQSLLQEAESSGRLPDLYESTGQEMLAKENGSSLDLLSEEEKENLYFSEELLRLANENNYIPTAFSIPVLFGNQKLEKLVEAESFSELEESAGDSTRICVVQEELEAMFLNAFDLAKIPKGIETVQNAAWNFLERRTAFSYVPVEDYRVIQEGMPGMYRVIPVKSEKKRGTFCEFWSINKESEDAAKRAAEKFLSYLLSDYAQDILFVQNSRGRPLPLSKNALEAYFYAYEELQPLSEDTEELYFR